MDAGRGSDPSPRSPFSRETEWLSPGEPETRRDVLVRVRRALRASRDRDAYGVHGMRLLITDANNCRS
jgi:hypothetical protein